MKLVELNQTDLQPLLIHSIYVAVEGEGIRLGTPQVMVRFQGCQVGCINCDSKETWDFTESLFARKMSLEKVMESVDQLSQGRITEVSITGGDPLHPKHHSGLVALISALKNENYSVNLEASGTRVVPEIFDRVDYISFDFKPPSTGVRLQSKLLCEAYWNYGVLPLLEGRQGKMQIKSIVSDEKDFLSFSRAQQEAFFFVQKKMNLFFPEKQHEFAENLNQQKLVPWVITPCYSPLETFPRELVLKIYEWNQEMGGPFRVILQQHKLLFGPDVLNV